MLNKIGLVALIITSTVTITFATTAPNIQEGLWEITTEVKIPEIPEIPGMGGMQRMQGMQGMKGLQTPTKHTKKQCLTNLNLVPDLSQKDQKCSTSSTTVKGDTVIWNLECDNHGMLTKGTGEITYKKTTLSGFFSMSIQNTNANQPISMKMTNNITGRRIGDCNPEN